MPTKFRMALDERELGRLTVTVHPDGCLVIFPRSEWLKFEASISALPITAHWWKRKFLSNADDVEIDAGGRILIPPELREAVNLPKEVLMIGLSSHLEVWDKAHFRQRIADETQGPMPDSLQNFSY